MTMKTRKLLIALAVFALGLLMSSCGKADFLEGTKWTRADDEGNPCEFLFSSSTRVVYMEFDSDGEMDYFAQGQYSGRKDLINLKLTDWNNNAYTVPGRIKGDKMTLEWDGEVVFKKVKK